MRVIFMGTPDFAVGTLEEILTAGHEVVLVVSQPDKAVGRSKALKYTPVKACAIAHGIPVYQPERVRDAECIAHLANYQPDIIIVEAFGQIIPGEILRMPRYGCVNVHASPLPRYRGASPIQWAVIHGDEVTGVTTMRMDEGLDTGDIIEQEEVRLAPDETTGSLFERLSAVGARLCVHTMAKIEAGEASYTQQEHGKATHTAKIRKELGSIDWTRGAAEIECLIRGMDPWPSAYTRLGDRILKIWKAQVVPEEPKGPPGCIVDVSRDGIFVQTGEGQLRLLEVQLEGKKRMPVEAFLNGCPVKAGVCFKKG